ncbi:MAG: hypothetical protein AABZ74_06520 [Cyanobacteriota bacterium]
MGGKALKNIQAIILNKNEFYELQNEVLKKLTSLTKDVIPIKSYFNKKDFGDLDILISKPKPDYKDLKKFLETEFNSKEIVNNSNIVSFEYNNFQIDLIFENKENLEIAEFYFSYNDLNNMIGKTAYSFGLKFGFTGLYYPIRTKHGNLYDEILLTNEPKRIYEFLEYDYERYSNGFNELEDIFEYVVSGKYFNPMKYLKEYEDKSLIDRTRTKKRKTYIEFIIWLENYIIQNKNRIYFEFNDDKFSYVEFIEKSFPKSELKEKIKDFKKNQEIQEEVNKKFNGKIVMNLITGLIGKELGEFIINFKDLISRENNSNFEEAVINHSEEEIKEKMLNYWNNNAKKNKSV